MDHTLSKSLDHSTKTKGKTPSPWKVICSQKSQRSQEKGREGSLKPLPIIWKPTILKGPQIWKVILCMGQMSPVRTDFPLPQGHSESRPVDISGTLHGSLQRVSDSGEFIRQGPWAHGVSKLSNSSCNPTCVYILSFIPCWFIYLLNSVWEPMC